MVGGELDKVLLLFFAVERGVLHAVAWIFFGFWFSVEAGENSPLNFDLDPIFEQANRVENCILFFRLACIW